MIISPRRRTSSTAARTAVAIMAHALIISVMNSRHRVHRLFPRTIHLIAHLLDHLHDFISISEMLCAKNRINDIRRTANDRNDIPLNSIYGFESRAMKQLNIFLISIFSLHFYAYICLLFIFLHISHAFSRICFLFILYPENYRKTSRKRHRNIGKCLCTYQGDCFVYILMSRQVTNGIKSFSKRFLRESASRGVY